MAKRKQRPPQYETFLNPVGLEFNTNASDFFKPDNNDSILSAVEFGVNFTPYYAGKGGWAEARGAAIVQSSGVLRMCPITDKTGKVTLSASIPVGATRDTRMLRELAKLLEATADKLDAGITCPTCGTQIPGDPNGAQQLSIGRRLFDCPSCNGHFIEVATPTARYVDETIPCEICGREAPKTLAYEKTDDKGTYLACESCRHRSR